MPVQRLWQLGRQGDSEGAAGLQGCTQLQPNLVSWSPDGLIACFHVEWTEESRSDRTWLWLWRPFQSAIQLQGIKIEWPFSERLVWSPCSSMVLLQADPGRSFICHVDGHVGWQDGPERVLEWTMTGVLSHGIGRSVSFGDEEQGLYQHAVAQGQLQRARLLSGLGCTSSVSRPLHALASSPDAAHIVSLARSRLDVYSAAAGCMVQLPVLPAKRAGLLSGYTARWTPDGSGLVCSHPAAGSHHLFVSFV